MTMNEKTLAALHGSIAKWEAIIAGTGGDKGASNCPLCKLHYGDDEQPCTGCPVAGKTGQPNCGGTPYEDFVDASTPKFVFELGWVPDSDEARAAAQAELDFLKSLLPAENATS